MDAPLDRSATSDPPEVRAGHVALGLSGLGLLRDWLDPDRARLRTDELRLVLEVLHDDELSPRRRPAEHDVRAGYARWAATYDTELNPLVAVEEPAVRAALADVPAGRALDAACGTGRHTEHLAALGHRVLGIDLTPEMLARARPRVPTAAVARGDLTHLPVADETVDVVVCALALSHLDRVGPVIAELARTLRPGGRLVLSDLHPYAAQMGGVAMFRDPDDPQEAAWVVTRRHQVSDYVQPALDVGLVVRSISEPLIDPVLPHLAPPMLQPAATAAFGGTPFALVVAFDRPAP